MMLDHQRHIAAASELAELGRPGAGALLEAAYASFYEVACSDGIISASSDMVMDFGEFDGDVLSVTVHVCRGLKCDEIPIRVLWRQTSMTPSQCMRASRGLGEQIRHASGDRNALYESPLLDGLLQTIRDGMHGLGIGGLDAWAVAARDLVNGGSVEYLGAHLLARNPHVPERQIIAHCCTEEECPEEPLKFRRCVMHRGTSNGVCGSYIQEVTPNQFMPPGP